MDFLSRMNQVVDRIEASLEEDIDYDGLARIACCSVYQFGRIFAYVVGIPLSEYIRRRRLSQAALALQNGDAKVIDVALAFGYNSPDAFGRAFLALHGVTPKEACAPGVKLKLYPRIAFHISIQGGVDLEYRIEQREVVPCVGVVRTFEKLTIRKDAPHWKEERPELWAVWDQFLNGSPNILLRDQYRLYRPPFWQVGITETLDNGQTVVRIGAQARPGESYPELTRFDIPAHTWAVFTATGTLRQKIHPITRAMTRALTEWLPTSGYALLQGMELEVYGPGDTRSEDYACELWLPVRKK